MALPDQMEIVPLAGFGRATVTVPGSKSLTNRALILAALGDGETVLRGALWSEDTQVMAECLQQLGFMVNVARDPAEPCNRTVTVYGKGGVVPAGGTESQPLELFVGNAGTAARFLAAFVCLGKGAYRLHGVARMHERPQAELFAALRQLGYEVDPEQQNEKLPARVYGIPAWPGVQPHFDPVRGAFVGSGARSCSVSIQESSQFASALMLCAQAGHWNVLVQGSNPEESPYLAMTSQLLKAFPTQGGVFDIEPDASSGSYFVAADFLVPQSTEAARGTAGPAVSVARWPKSGWQIDAEFPSVMLLNSGLSMGLGYHRTAGVFGRPTSEQLERTRRQLPPECVISRAHDLGDSIMTAVVLAPFSLTPVRFTELGRLRLQECERVSALRSELSKCGARVIEAGDSLTVHPSELHGAEIETYGDHRLAMCFAILGLKVPGIILNNPACVKKTFPNFFQKLAAPPPQGLGVVIRDPRSGRVLPWQDLFAD